MNSVNAYLTFSGTCEEAFNFYKAAFKGEFTYLGRFGEMPPGEDGNGFPPAEADKIMHVSLPIGNTVLMGSDSSEAFGHATVMGNNIALSINTESRPEADRLFGTLSAEGKVTMPMENTFWGAYFGMFTDKFGIIG